MDPGKSRSPFRLGSVGVCALLVCLTGCCDARFRLAERPDGTIVKDAPRWLGAADRAEAWKLWADRHLESGDILFGMSDARALWGMFPFARVMLAMTHSRFSHTGMAVLEQEGYVVYDMAPGGPRRLSFPDYMERVGLTAFAVKRVKPEYRSVIPVAVAYTQQIYREHSPFDCDFSMDDDKLYCVELTEKAYRAGGLQLSNPVRFDTMPGYEEFPRLTRWIHRLTKVRRNQLVFLPGNETMGIWCSPVLEVVYDNGEPGSYDPLAVEAERLRQEEALLGAAPQLRGFAREVDSSHTDSPRNDRDRWSPVLGQ